MGTLSGILNIALGAMNAEQGALSVTANNIANVNTPGYARQIPVFEENPALLQGPLTWGTGVSLARIESIRDSVLEIRIHQESQDSGRLDAFLNAMNQIQALFNEPAGTGLSGPLTSFFNAWQQLASDPANLSLRQNLLTAAQNLASAFRQTITALDTEQHNLDLGVQQSVATINRLTAEIANLNGQIRALTSAGQDASSLVAQREALLGQLSALVDVQFIDSGNGGLTLTTANGTPLVLDHQSFALETASDPLTGLTHIFAQGNDITAQIRSGQLAGLLAVRDGEIPALQGQLDTLAAALANAVNAQHQAGYDLNGNPGGNFFTPPAGSTGAAANLSVAISDPALIAASADGTPGNNGNANAIAALANSALIAGQSPATFYAGVVFGVGNTVANASAQKDATDLVLQQLNTQRGALSGVSLDEEAASLLRFEQAYNAAARVATTIVDLTAAAIQLGKD